jgi:hypothetical protein
MRITLYPLTSEPPLIRPAEMDRHWMDETPDRFAYRCLPLNMANQHGWEFLCPVDVAARWNGGPNPEDIEVRTSGTSQLAPQSHFGSGVLTFQLGTLLRTDPGYNLWVTGPINAAKDAIQPLSGLVETDWSPYTFTMNWRFTRAGEMVAFTLGEPVCHVFPVPRMLAESVELVTGSLDDDPALKARYEGWAAGRTAFNEALHQPGSAAQEEKWQRSYFRGQNPDGSPGSTEHQTKLDLCPLRPRLKQSG